MDCNLLNQEQWFRVVGQRQRPPIGQPPSAEARAVHASLQQYRTRAPKGVFLYRSHEQMDADRWRWTVAAMVERASGG